MSDVKLAVAVVDEIVAMIDMEIDRQIMRYDEAVRGHRHSAHHLYTRAVLVKLRQKIIEKEPLT